MGLNLVTIRGTPDQLRDLYASPVGEVEINDHGATRLEGGRYEVGAYASESAVAEIRSRGLEVDVEMDNAELTANLEDLIRRATSPGEV